MNNGVNNGFFFKAEFLHLGVFSDPLRHFELKLWDPLLFQKGLSECKAFFGRSY